MNATDVISGSSPWSVESGDCLTMLPLLSDGCVDAVVCDPPYALTEPRSGGNYYHRPRTEEEKAASSGGFMGKKWDSELPTVSHWQAIKRVLKTGGYLLAFGGTRTYHRLACAIEDAGFELRDCIMWLYGSGFPKGLGCLKPAYEPILLARNKGPRVLPLGIDECRIPIEGETLGGGRVTGSVGQSSHEGWRRPWMEDPEMKAAHVERAKARMEHSNSSGRYPANIIHDGSEEVEAAFAEFGERNTSDGRITSNTSIGYGGSGNGPDGKGYGDYGSASRFFYCAKASRAERNEGCHDLPGIANRVNAPCDNEAANFAASKGNHHPTVKPVALMQWLIKLVCLQDGIVLDPYAGSGSTGVACRYTQRRFIGIDLDPVYVEIARKRIGAAAPLEDAIVRAKTKAIPAEPGLFDTLESTS